MNYKKNIALYKYEHIVPMSPWVGLFKSTELNYIYKVRLVGFKANIQFNVTLNGLHVKGK